MFKYVIAAAAALTSVASAQHNPDLFPAVRADQVEGVPYVLSIESTVPQPVGGANFNVLFADINGDFRFDYVGVDGAQVNLDDYHFTGDWDAGNQLLTANAVAAINETLWTIPRFAPEYSTQLDDGKWLIWEDPRDTVIHDVWSPYGPMSKDDTTKPVNRPLPFGRRVIAEPGAAETFVCTPPPMCPYGANCILDVDSELSINDLADIDARTREAIGDLENIDQVITLIVPMGTEIFTCGPTLMWASSITFDLPYDHPDPICKDYEIYFYIIDGALDYVTGFGFRFPCSGRNPYRWDDQGDNRCHLDMDPNGLGDFGSFVYPEKGMTVMFPSRGRAFALTAPDSQQRWEDVFSETLYTSCDDVFNREESNPGQAGACVWFHPHYTRCIEDCDLNELPVDCAPDPI